MEQNEDIYFFLREKRISRAALGKQPLEVRRPRSPTYKKGPPPNGDGPKTRQCREARAYFLRDSSTATAHATVQPTMGLLPMPMRPIMSTCAGTELEPANCALECMRPMVSVMP